MKKFFEKYMHVLTEKLALKMIHSKLHKVLKEYKEGESYTKELLEIHCMIEDLLESKGVEIPERK